MLLCVFNNTINKAGHTGSSFVSPGLLFSHGVKCHKEGPRKITIGSEQGSTAGPQNRAARLALGCTQRANVNHMHVNLSWLKVEERLTSSLVFMRGIDMLNAPSCLSKLLAHSLDTHSYPTRHATRGLFIVPKSRTDYGRHTVLNRAMTT